MSNFRLNPADQAQGARSEGPSKEGRSSFMDKLEGVVMPNPVVSPLIYEGEVSLLFAFAGTGKSFMSFQIARSLAMGERVFGLETASPQKVLYLDTEMTLQQLKARYDGIHFPENFVWEPLRDHSQEEAYSRIGKSVEKVKPQIVILDNISSLGAMDSNPEKIILILKYLRSLRDAHNLTVLIVAHTPKGQLGKPITEASFYGSSALGNFVDSSFALGTSSTGESYRYLMQLKSRISEKVYGETNVIELLLERDRKGFLGFTYQREVPEKELLSTRSHSDNSQLKAEACLLRSEGMSWNMIADTLEKPRDTVRVWAKDVPKGTTKNSRALKDVPSLSSLLDKIENS